MQNQEIAWRITIIACLVLTLLGCEDKQLLVKQSENSHFGTDYQLSSGDALSIKVFGHDDLTLNNIRVDDAGKISYPFLGELNVAGMTTGALEQQLTTQLDGDYIVDPKVTVSILQYRQFFINGEVNKPGGYAFLPGLTIQKAVTLAGGFTELALRSGILLIREQDQTMQPQPANLNTAVNPGDIIIVKESFF